jgi:hypothetical protein
MHGISEGDKASLSTVSWAAFIALQLCLSEPTGDILLCCNLRLLSKYFSTSNLFQFTSSTFIFEQHPNFHTTTSI